MVHEGVHIAELVTGIVILMLVAAATTVASKRVNRLPLTIALVFVGIGIAALAKHLPFLQPVSNFHLTAEVVLFVFIPTLIFESAFNLNARQVARNIWPILTLAVPGLLLSTAIIGLVMILLTDFDLMVALLLGAILSATDPVAVIAIFKQLGVPERLTILVEGESLFNDATSLVLATLLLGILVAGEFSATTVAEGLVEFFVVFVGGVLVGWSLALLTGLLLGNIESDPDIEITLTTILAYFSFIIAEHVFHVSGIMAVVAAGLTIGSWGKSKISPSTEEFMVHFWEYLSYLANALIFLMVGMQIDLVVLVDSIGLIACVVVAMLVSRLVVVFGLVPIVGKVPGSDPIGMPFQQVMFWGGLRGAIALAIVLSLPEFEYKQTLIAVVMGAVLFTLVAQGLTIELLVKWLGLDKPSVPDSLAQLEGDRNARHEGMARLSNLVSGGIFSQRVSDNLREKCEREIAALEVELQQLHKAMTAQEEKDILLLRCLVQEKARYHELFGRGLINEWAFRELDHTIDVQLDDVRHRGLPPTHKFGTPPGKMLDVFIVRFLDHVPGFADLVEERRTQRIIRDYDISWGRFRGVNTVLNNLTEFAREGDVKADVIAEVRAIYQHILDEMKAQLDEVAELYPEFVETMQGQLAQRLLLVAEHESVEQAAGMGMIQEGIANKILREQSERIRQLKRDDLTASLEIEVTELLRKVPVFEGIKAAEFNDIASFLKPRSVPRKTHIIDQGAAGNSMFLIARGVANVFITTEGEREQVQTLYAGDFFGEAAMLHGTARNATIVAVTPCSLYELSSTDLNRICERHPAIRDAVMKVDVQRLKSNTTRHTPKGQS